MVGGSLLYDLAALCVAAAVAALLGYLACRGGRHCRLLWIFSALLAVSAAVYVVVILTYLPGGNGAVRFLAGPLQALLGQAGLLAAVVLRELDHRENAAVLTAQAEAAREGYEDLRAHNEEVMMLRHDMAGHYRLLREKAAAEAPGLAGYLDELLLQNAAIRPVVSSGNGTLDLLLNAGIHSAARAGVHVELARMNAPEELPLSDAELLSLVSNVLNNAVEAASKTEARLIRLDVWTKNNFFVLRCENTAPEPTEQDDTPGGAVPVHGLGSKIIKRIARGHGGLLKQERADGWFKLTAAIPLE